MNVFLNTFFRKKVLPARQGHEILDLELSYLQLINFLFIYYAHLDSNIINTFYEYDQPI